MSLHQEHTHGHAFHGLEARDILEAQKRDSHGDRIVMHVPDDMRAAARPADPAQTKIQNNRLVHSPLQNSRGPSRVVHTPLQFTRTAAVDNKLNFIHNLPTPSAAAPDNKMNFIHNPHSLDEMDNKMRFIHNIPSAEVKNGVVTVQSTQYITMSKTFSGPAVFVTEGGAHHPVEATRSSAQTSATDDANAAAAASYNSIKSLAHAGATTPIASSSTLVDPSAPVNTVAPSSLQSTTFATTSSAAAVAAAVGSPIQGTRGASAVAVTQSPSAELVAEQHQGMSGGAKAGLAIGIILAILLTGGLIFFFLRRRKAEPAQDHHQIIDEKRGAQGGDVSDYRESVQSEKVPASLRSTRTASTAPRLSLRPTTQFLSGLMENRKSTGNALDAPSMSEKPKSLWERRPQNSQDPFADAAAVSEKQTNPFDSAENEQRYGTPNHSQKSSLEGSEPATPKSTKFGTAAAVSVTSGNAMPAGPNNVHRVQLDFKPSMEDELELRSGQLVRMLHEYDDGWALCIRMDRSQQGVCPRTCLSKLPVKPRPQGPPSNGQQSRSGAPRPISPQDNGMVPRPLTPNSQNRERSQTDGWNAPASHDMGRNRSASAANKPLSPTSVSRKPVPGQAL